jgi:outer membrane biogenesis lipoprotein LolB
MIKSKLTLLLCASLFLAGCSTVVPVARKFPDAPKFMQACPELQKLNNEAKLSDVATTVTINYSTYYECAVKNDAWIEWYQIQKNIFESVK